MPVLLEEIEMVKNGENRGGHGPERSHRNVEAVPQIDDPREEGIGDNGDRRRVEAADETLNRSLHEGVDRSDETGEVVGAAELRGEDIGDCGEADVGGSGFAGDEAVPLVGDDEGDEKVGFSEREELAEVDEGVDMAAAGVGHRHNVAVDGAGSCRSDRIHGRNESRV